MGFTLRPYQANLIARSCASLKERQTPVLLARPLDRHPGADWCLLLQGLDGAITGGFHRGRQLDAAEAVAVRQAHEWETTCGAEAAAG